MVDFEATWIKPYTLSLEGMKMAWLETQPQSSLFSWMDCCTKSGVELAVRSGLPLPVRGVDAVEAGGGQGAP